MRSLRARLLVSALVGTSLTFATVGVGVYAVARNRMRADLDASLVSLARTSVAAAVAELSWGRLDEEEPTPRFTLDGLCFSPWLVWPWQSSKTTQQRWRPARLFSIKL